MAIIPPFFFLPLLTFVHGCWSDEGWILYMINGKELQYKNILRYGTNPDGFGVQAVSDSGAYKMSEEVFNSHKFSEVMATNTISCNSWVKIKKVDGSTITASEAFAVDMIGTIIQVARDDGSVKTLPPWAGHTRFHGPFYQDIFGCGWGWMWTDHHGVTDLRKGSLFGCSSVTNYAWIWYGRGPTETPSISPTVIPTKQPTYSFVVTSPGNSDIFAVGDTIEISWTADSHTSDFVDIQLCNYVSGGALECFNHNRGITSASDHHRNNGFESIIVLEDPNKDCVEWYAIKIIDDTNSDLFALSEYFRILSNAQSCADDSSSGEKDEDLADFIQNLFQQMQTRFKNISDFVIKRLDEMAHRLNDLEDLMSKCVVDGAAADSVDENDENKAGM